MRNFINHTRSYIFRGLLAIIPLLLCALALQLLYVLIDKRVMGFLDNFIHVRHIPGLGVLLVLICLYCIGLVVSNIVGRQFFSFIEEITRRIPLVKSVYGMGKQLSQGLSVAEQDKQAFKKAVLIKVDNGLMIPGFVMSSMPRRATADEEYFFVLIPTAPTPASGFVFVVKSSQIIDPGWTIEECLKAIVSVGIIAPKDTKFGSFSIPINPTP